MSLPLKESNPRDLCLHINTATPLGGLFEGDRANLHPDSRLPWRISPEPFWLTPVQHQFLIDLGPTLLAFYRASNLLYQQSVRGIQPAWVHQYLDRGKPQQIVEFGRMNRFKTQVPPVIRPDLLLTEEGFRVTELDSIPGGIGFTAHLSGLYADLGYDLVGGGDGLVTGFYEALQTSTRLEKPAVAIVVSDESDTYREEMQWLAQQLHDRDLPVYCRHPSDVHFDEEGLFIIEGNESVRLDAIYRFFELFDLKNIPKAEPITYFAKKNAVRLAPPLKAYLEEKMWLALLHHPLLRQYWDKELGRQQRTLLAEVVPQSWILDATAIPPHAVIPGLEIGGSPVNNWDCLKDLTKKGRELVVKPSGFSEDAQHSRGVSIGHDLPEEVWADRVQAALDQFDSGPYILQQFHKAARVTGRYYDFYKDEVRPMRGRALLRPYYYVVGDEAKLAGIQSILCPPDKKLLHGMIDAVLTPCAVAEDVGQDG